ncbi:hypothetical protein EDF31_11233 [Curtobacterium sp. PhB142]|uniref:hypothetical protein n=1 Tax=unclassified Curtobacterium TaxID=257496 RepID=UPI00104E4549|nr:MULTISPECIES: hypothetical protein [unclassified Curtobacterium]TCL80515.1 hypothetical protein EDF31_11233 [Curtobacterium sp. PhB142]TCL99755.1 hypothetical protein EDF26_11333 [Curtobacterium sp. PhB134]TCU43920.1 hypothetical protein EDF33_10733 [Curtobacterium sp. PhB146]TDW43097.1 hypothetical protein EDF52_11351 [Curtobacterium sp. PhB42]TDW53605.1 hypothetical protein EDF47_109117 [Curtobacterium sp. PhB190]
MSARQDRDVPAWVVFTVVFGAVVIILGAGLALGIARQTSVPAPERAAVTPTTTASTAPVPPSAPSDTPESAAAGFVTAFTDHQAPADAWEKTFSGYLTEQAKTAYAGTDRTQVPGIRVTGKAVVTAGVSAAPVPGSADDDGESDPVPAIVTVPTDAGRYTVNLQQQDGRWLVVSAQLPRSGQ